MCSCDQSLVTLAFLLEKLPWPQLCKDLNKKPIFVRGALGASSIIWDYDWKYNCSKGVETKSQKIFGAIFLRL